MFGALAWFLSPRIHLRRSSKQVTVTPISGRTKRCFITTQTVTITTMEQKLADVSDIFDSVVSLDESLRQEGFEDGYKDGLVSGKEEGKEVGLKMGFQVAEELGFYQGCVDVWNTVIQVDSGAFSSRLQKSVQQLGDLVRKYPLLDPENEQVQEMMDGIRLKFRIISANMGVKLEYKGYTKSSGMEDM
ncbi:hypothetical protein C4D60_Mb01t30040 [Musa balbisiana]|uniref:Essential protein Yae1 N-terminal domain-containing protein n=1 Tax=Musa balbisiana TaxID=52838 RepID=A0A4S8JRS8_MUSBA|nr:hypothetical protein C4D60_Mb01t30040 [Musa balbisiana]